MKHAMSSPFIEAIDNKSNLEACSRIIHVASERYGVERHDILGYRRHRTVAAVRQICMFAIRQCCPGMTYCAIGRFFDRDHGTALHACATVKNEMDVYPKVRADVEAFLKSVK